jgi:hypothetical protein
MTMTVLRRENPKLYRTIVSAIANSHFKRETVEHISAEIDRLATKMPVADDDDK